MIYFVWKTSMRAHNAFECICSLTHCLRKAIDSLTIRICLIPYEGVGQVGWGMEPLLKEVTFNSHHQMHFDQAEGYHCLGHGDLQQRAVACCTWTQVAELQIGAWYLNQFMKDLKDMMNKRPELAVNRNWEKNFSLKDNEKKQIKLLKKGKAWLKRKQDRIRELKLGRKKFKLQF